MRWAVLACAAALLVSSCRTPPKSSSSSATPETVALSQNRNIRFGMPAPASTNPLDKTHYLIERPQYVLSYNEETRCPNWVSWNLVKSDIGPTPRGSFTPDPSLPPEYAKVKSSTYDNSGFDRGHMCNSKDRSSSTEHNDATFFMTNIVPQAPNNNQQGWEELESYCRELAKKGSDLYIVCGPHGTGGEGRNGHKDSIGKSGIFVSVPAQVWKVVLVLPSPGAQPNRDTMTIAVWMPNDQSVDTNWRRFLVSVKEVEKRTGYHFYPAIPSSVAEPMKSRIYSVESQASARIMD